MTRKAEERLSGKDSKSTTAEGDRTERRRAPRKPREKATNKADGSKSTGRSTGKASTKSAPPRPSRRRASPPVRTPAEEAREVELRNRRYYDAFQSLDSAAMARCWWQDELASCVHPGWDIRHGWTAIREGYDMIFAGTQSIRFALGDVRVRVVGALAYVTCIENLVTEEGAGSGDYLGAVLATNVFEKRRGDWKLIHHHASPFAPDEIELPEGPLH